MHIVVTRAQAVSDARRGHELGRTGIATPRGRSRKIIVVGRQFGRKASLACFLEGNKKERKGVETSIGVIQAYVGLLRNEIGRRENGSVKDFIRLF